MQQNLSPARGDYPIQCELRRFGINDGDNPAASGSWIPRLHRNQVTGLKGEIGYLQQ
jgi:hypothetical protein